MKTKERPTKAPNPQTPEPIRAEPQNAKTIDQRHEFCYALFPIKHMAHIHPQRNN